jgi:hypothetical protein
VNQTNIEDPMSSSNDDGAWKVVGASIIGAGHQTTSRPCQDVHAWRPVRDDWVVIAVADGAGSAPLSEVGARTAVDCAIVRLGERLGRHLDGQVPLDNAEAWRSALKEVLTACFAAVEQEATIHQVPIGELACTLLLAVLGPGLTVSAQIGDGAIVAQKQDGTIALLTVPDFGEDVNTTTFLVSAAAVNRLQFAHMQEPVRSAAVFTDGIEMLALNLRRMAASWAWEPHLPFFEHLFAFFHRQNDSAAAAAALDGLLTSPRVRDRTDDDVTLVVASRRQLAAATTGPGAAESALATT